MKPRCMLVANYTPMCSLWDMGRDIRSALENAGVSVMEYLRSDFQNDEMGRVMVKALVDFKGPKFFLDMNANEHYRVGDRTLFDAYGIPRLSFITDSPLRHLSKIRAMPANAAVGLVDGDFAAILDDFNLTQRSFAFPHAGPAPLAEQQLDCVRDIDILFSGNIEAQPNLSEFIDLHAGTDSSLRTKTGQAVEAAFETTQSLYSLSLAAFQEVGLEKVLSFGNALESFLIAHRRRDLLGSLKQGSDRVTVCGVIHSSVRRDLPGHLDFTGAGTFEDILDRVGRCRVLIDSSPSFRNGAHERIFYGLSRGARVLTEPTRFFSPEDQTGLELEFLPFSLESLGQTLDRLRSQQDVSREARLHHYAGSHTWAQRLPALLTAVTGIQQKG